MRRSRVAHGVAISLSATAQGPFSKQDLLPLRVLIFPVHVKTIKSTSKACILTVAAIESRELEPGNRYFVEIELPSHEIELDTGSETVLRGTSKNPKRIPKR